MATYYQPGGTVTAFLGGMPLTVPAPAGTGTTPDIISRLQRWLPARWFPTYANGTVTRIGATVAGYADAFAQVYSELAYVKLQARIKTATDGFLDLISFDFFGPALPRKGNESDNRFRARILANLLRPRATRQGVSATLKILTGRTPRIFEPQRPIDTGVWDGGYIGFDVAGGWSDLSNLVPYQAQVFAYFGNGVAASDIYTALDQAKPAGTVTWTAVQPNALRFGDAPNSYFIPCIGGR